VNNSKEKIITIDISSNSIKTGLISTNLELESSNKQALKIDNEDLDGFAKTIDMLDLWNKIVLGIKQLLKSSRNDDLKIIGISTCAQRIATVFLDKSGDILYAGPNTDLRGIDSAYLIEDSFSEEELFKITAHNPSLLFCLARLLWFKEEKEEVYGRIHKLLMLDDWLIYKLTGILCTDLTSIAESQLVDIKKAKWSREITEVFKINPNIFPPIIETGSQVGFLKSNLQQKFNIKYNEIPVIKNGADTQTSLLGMGAIEKTDLGISLGTTAPLHLILDKPYIDPELNFWTTFHSIPNTWILEAHAGNTGASYNWFKTNILSNLSENPDLLIDQYLRNSKPGALSTFAYLGPELMNIKDQTSIKRGVFVFPPPMMISDALPKIYDFTRSIIENIAFGIYENYKALLNFPISKVFCAGGMAKSVEILKIIANVLGIDIIVPEIKDSSFIGAAMSALKALDYYKDYVSIIKENLKFNTISKEKTMVDNYKHIYLQWKNIKNKIDIL